MDHAVEKAGPDKLTHISVTIPAFDIEASYDTGQRKKQKELKSGSHYQCGVCGLAVTADEVCGCVDFCDTISSGQQMKPAK